MTLIELSEKDKPDYNHFIVAAESGSFLQSYEWGEWQEQLGRKAHRYFVKDDGGQIIASMQLIAMPLAFGKYYLYCPYGPVTLTLPSPNGRGEGERVNFQSIINDLISKFSNPVFLRIEPKYLLPTTHYPLPTKSANIQPAKTLAIDLSKSEQQLLAEMHPKTRYNIRVAQKHGVGIKDEFDISIGHGLFTKEAVELIVETSRRQGFRGYGSEYFRRMIDFFAIGSPSPRPSPQGRGEKIGLHIYKAVYHQQLLASAIMLDFSAKGGSASGGGTRTFLFGGSAEAHKNVMAPYLMHWQAILDAKNAGLALYDFWGVETSVGDMPGFVRFKLGFGGQVKDYSGAYDVINNRFLYLIYRFFRYIHRLL